MRVNSFPVLHKNLIGSGLKIHTDINHKHYIENNFRVYCKQGTQPNLTRPTLDAFRPFGLLSRACPVPQTKILHLQLFVIYVGVNLQTIKLNLHNVI